jgi:hypothetical protein
MAEYFGIHFRDNKILWDEPALLASLDQQFPQYELFLEFFPALAGGGDYFVNSAKVRATGAYIKPLNPKGFQISMSQTAALQPQLDELARAMARAMEDFLPSGKPRPKRRR